MPLCPKLRDNSNPYPAWVPSSNLTYLVLHPSLGKAGKQKTLGDENPRLSGAEREGGGLGSSALNHRDLSLSAPAALERVYFPQHPEQKLTSVLSGPALGKGVSVNGQLF